MLKEPSFEEYVNNLEDRLEDSILEISNQREKVIRLEKKVKLLEELHYALLSNVTDLYELLPKEKVSEVSKPTKPSPKKKLKANAVVKEATRAEAEEDSLSPAGTFELTTPDKERDVAFIWAKPKESMLSTFRSYGMCSFDELPKDPEIAKEYKPLSSDSREYGMKAINREDWEALRQKNEDDITKRKNRYKAKAGAKAKTRKGKKK